MTTTQEPQSSLEGSAGTETRPVTSTWRRVAVVLILVWPALVLGAYFAPRLFGTGEWFDGMIGPLRRPQYLITAVLGAGRAAAAALWLAASAGTVGWLLARLLRWELRSLTERIVHPMLLGVGVLAMLGLGAAALGLYRPMTLIVLAALPLLSWLYPTLRPRPLDGWDRTEFSWSRADRIWLAVLAAAVAMALVAAFAPAVEYDELWYHLYFPRLALEHGTLVDLRDEYVSLYPMLWGLWYGYGLSLGGAIGAKLLHTICLPLTLLVVHDLVRRYGGRANPWIALALFATIPLVIWQAGSAYNDLALALLTVAAVHAMLRYAESARRQWLVLAGVSLGVALASKMVAMVVVAVSCLWLLGLLSTRDRSLRSVFTPAFLVGAIAVAIAAVWYVRAWWLGGNPVLPEMYGVFGADPERWNENAAASLERFMSRFGRPRTPGNLLTLPWDMTMRPERYGGTFGPLLLALVPLMLLRRSSWQLRALAVFALGFLALWASPLASYQLRWLMPVAPLLAVLAAVGASRAGDVLREGGWHWARRVGAVLIATVMLVQLPPFGAIHRRHLPQYQGWVVHTTYNLPLPVVTGMWPRWRYLEHMVPTFRTWEVADTLLPADALVLVYWGGDHFYSTRARIPAGSVRGRAAAFAPPDSIDAALRAAERIGITHVLWNDRFLQRYRYTQTAEDFALTRSANRDRWLELLHEHQQTRLYRLRSRAEVEASSASQE